MPYFLAADSRKSNTSFSDTIDLCEHTRDRSGQCDANSVVLKYVTDLEIALGTLER